MKDPEGSKCVCAISSRRLRSERADGRRQGRREMERWSSSGVGWVTELCALVDSSVSILQPQSRRDESLDAVVTAGIETVPSIHPSVTRERSVETVHFSIGAHGVLWKV